MIYIFDNFYSDPLFIREMALKKDFYITGNFDGYRTDYEENNFNNLKVALQNILNIPIINWPASYNTSYQYTTQNSDTWIHHDETVWAGVIYLTPNAPKESGTGIYRHIDTHYYRHTINNTIDFNSIYSPQEEWELIRNIDNVFNRLVLYPGNYYHRSMLTGFGNDKYSGRLFQVFFFDT